MTTQKDTKDINQRITELMHYYNLNANSLSKRLEIPTPTIRNVVNGRNKPGFDLILTILNSFEEVSSDWLVRGEGGMLEKPIKHPDLDAEEGPITRKVRSSQHVMSAISGLSEEEFRQYMVEALDRYEVRLLDLTTEMMDVYKNIGALKQIIKVKAALSTKDPEAIHRVFTDNNNPQ